MLTVGDLIEFVVLVIIGVAFYVWWSKSVSNPLNSHKGKSYKKSKNDGSKSFFDFDLDD